MAEKIGSDTSCEGTGKGCEYHWRDPWRGDKDSSYGKAGSGRGSDCAVYGEYLCHENQRESRGLYAVRHDSGRRSRY